MFNTVKIGAEDVPMLSMASVDLYYRQIFHEDPIALQAGDKPMSEGEAISFYCRMGFVMAKFADLKKRGEMLKLNEDAFFDWMDSFERPDLLSSLGDIRDTYEGQALTASNAKKKDAEQSFG